uniref:Uncharacterized protein n=1 Tax=Candidatus Kentrum sp. FM TaxID=2126340 RepID=A0A450U081_9GAMM|nr:MAG: hypothetical protein BECKFM1743C_GA0114222_108571 [Candidatus Kentron sp. FM]VFJ75707.1 MAG: hypothetical protein BECKFM1743A_GA0114220_108641 [Candidatus Kentron sp. FM]VFK22206.1 MAG: hypothetical protein BECKFM1743B_GA0114221_108441 [Candidatus Kentron sp. FM]
MVLTVALREDPPEGEPKCRVSIKGGTLSPLLVATARQKVKIHYELRVSKGDKYKLFTNAADAATAYISLFGNPTWLPAEITTDQIKAAGRTLDKAVTRVADNSGIIDKSVDLVPYKEAHSDASSIVRIDLASFRKDWDGYEVSMLENGPFWTEIYLDPVGSLFHIRNGNSAMWDSLHDMLGVRVGASGSSVSIENYLRLNGKVRPEEFENKQASRDELIEKCYRLQEVFRSDLKMTNRDALVARFAVIRRFAHNYTLTEDQKLKGDRCFSEKDHKDLVDLNPLFSFPVKRDQNVNRTAALNRFFAGEDGDAGFSDRLESRSSMILKEAIIGNTEEFRFVYKPDQELFPTEKPWFGFGAEAIKRFVSLGVWSETDRQVAKNRNDLGEIGVFLTTSDRENPDGSISIGHRYPALLKFTPAMKLAAIEVRDVNSIRSTLALPENEIWPTKPVNRAAAGLSGVDEEYSGPQIQDSSLSSTLEQ